MDSPGDNRFEYQWKQQENKHVGVDDLIFGRLVVIYLDPQWNKLNKDMHTPAHAFDLLNQFNVNVNVLESGDILYVPLKYLQMFEEMDVHQACFGIALKNCIYGFVCLQWDEGDALVRSNEIYKTCGIIGGGSFSKPVNLNLPHSPLMTVNVEFQMTIDGITNNYKYSVDVIQSVRDEILSQSTQPLGFYPNNEYNIGFVCLPLRIFWGADLKVCICLIFGRLVCC